eukprot:866231-Pleurochrysis_carterae.AAC.1
MRVCVRACARVRERECARVSARACNCACARARASLVIAAGVNAPGSWSSLSSLVPNEAERMERQVESCARVETFQPSTPESSGVKTAWIHPAGRKSICV